MNKEQTAEQNKNIASSFLTMSFNDRKPSEAALQYVSTAYKQHNPTIADGRDAFVAFCEGYVSKFPEFRLTIKRVIAENDLVTLHSHTTTVENDKGTAIIDIFRIAEGKIVEHWDVIQQVPEQSANNNTMF